MTLVVVFAIGMIVAKVVGSKFNPHVSFSKNALFHIQ